MKMQRANRIWQRLPFLALTLVACLISPAEAQVCNVKVVTDANPDYSDMESMIHSVTSHWSTATEKCWAMFYWNHIARRQTAPMILHGREVTDPIRQFNDYGFMMCSTIAGTNCAIWHHMGMDVRFWDISLHTVSECFYENRWHIYDNSMSAVYTLCDGVTVAGVEDAEPRRSVVFLEVQLEYVPGLAVGIGTNHRSQTFTPRAGSPSDSVRSTGARSNACFNSGCSVARHGSAAADPRPTNNVTAAQHTIHPMRLVFMSWLLSAELRFVSTDSRGHAVRFRRLHIGAHRYSS